jgi:biotin carboxyl carrier protein
VEGVRKEKLAVKLDARLGERMFHLVIKELTGVNGHRRLEVTLSDSKRERSYQVELLGRHRDRWTLKFDDLVEDFVVFPYDQKTLVEWKKQLFPIEISSRREMYRRQKSDDQFHGETTVRAEMPGKIIRIMKSVGDPVVEGEGVVVVEAMKMQNEIDSPRNGTLLGCDVKEGDSVGAGDILFRVVGQAD